MRVTKSELLNRSQSRPEKRAHRSLIIYNLCQRSHRVAHDADDHGNRHVFFVLFLLDASVSSDREGPLGKSEFCAQQVLRPRAPRH